MFQEVYRAFPNKYKEFYCDVAPFQAVLKHRKVEVKKKIKAHIIAQNANKNSSKLTVGAVLFLVLTL